MKKTMIAAGAASVALAAMPIVGAFAAPSTIVNSQTDTLIINIGSACSIGYDSDISATGSTIEVEGVAHADDSGAWGDGTGTPTPGPGDEGHPDTLAVTMLNATAYPSLGTTTLGIYCNDEDGYTITADTPTAGGNGELSSTTVSTKIPLTANFGDGSSSTVSGWSFKLAAGASNRGVVKNGHTAWSGNNTASSPRLGEVVAGSNGISGQPQTTTNAGDFYTITYGAGIDETTPAATYKGQITYTLAQL